MNADRLASLLVGGDENWRALSDEGLDRLVSAARAHGVLPLLAERAADPDVPCAPVVRQALGVSARSHLAADLVREQALRELMAALANSGVRALLVKGADLAYSRYARPDLRPRIDSDILIRPVDRQAAEAVLASLGYEAVPQTGGDLLMYQAPFRLRQGDIDVHVVDLHWRLMNPQRFGVTLEFDELWAASETRPALSTAARGLGGTHALMLACLHRVAHHYDSERLIWTYDIHTLASALDARAWADFVALAGERRVQRVCLRGLEVSTALLRTRPPVDVLRTLRDGGASEVEHDPFLNRSATHASRVLSDVWHVGGWQARVRLMRQHVFPPARYMRHVYAPSSSAPLLWLYLVRVCRGSRKWLSRS